MKLKNWQKQLLQEGYSLPLRQPHQQSRVLALPYCWCVILLSMALTLWYVFWQQEPTNHFSEAPYPNSLSPEGYILELIEEICLNVHGKRCKVVTIPADEDAVGSMGETSGTASAFQ